MEDDNTTKPAETIDSPPASKEITPDPAVRFRGLGTNFRAKLIGIDDIPDSRGDKMCQESIIKLKAAVLASGRHKQRVVINVSLEGIKIVDITTGEVQHVHPVHRISFIARDLTDRRAFGYVYGAGEGKHQFFGIKTAKVAEVLVLALRDLFQVVYDMKKKEIEDAKTHQNGEEVQEHVPAPQQQQQVNQAPIQQQQQGGGEGNLFALEQQLTTIQEGINNIDSIGPWPQDLPTSPDTPGFGDGSGSDLFGIANLSDISSLSSDFSCASNSVVDYGHAGGGDRASNKQQFERSGSSRSAISWQGFTHQQRHTAARASSHSAGNGSRLLSVPDDFSDIKSNGGSDNKMSASQSQGSSDSVRTEFKIPHSPSAEKKENKPKSRDGSDSRPPAIMPTKDTLHSSSSIQSLPGSEKKTKKRSFFSRSKKSKSKNKKDKNTEKPNSSKLGHSRNSSSTEIPDNIKQSNTLSHLTRQGSVSSVRSCVVPSTTYNVETTRLSKSRTSLNDESTRPADTRITFMKPRSVSAVESKDTVTTHPSYIVQSSICPRTRPKAKHSGRVEEAENNPHNPPMFKTHFNFSQSSSKSEVSDNVSRDKTTYPQNSHEITDSQDTHETENHEWTASFDTNFDNFQKNKVSVSVAEEDFDPFTGQVSSETKLPLSASSVFSDTDWVQNKDNPTKDKPIKKDNSPTYSNGFSNSATNDDFFAESTVADFAEDPFAPATNNSPFDGVDPFGAIKMEDPLNDPFSVFTESDPFQNTESEDIENMDKNFTNFNKEEKIEDFSQSESQDEPTFPIGSDEFISNFDDFNVKATSVDSSSLTSGMSTPINTQSPVHNAKTLPTTTSNTPPTLPPRLPPRPPKKTSPLVTSNVDECPNEPPPPLPDRCLPSSFDETEDDFSFDEGNEEDYDIDSPDYLPPDLPQVPSRLPPVIPERAKQYLQAPSNQMMDSDDTSSNDELKEDSSSEQSNGSSGQPKQTSNYSDELFDLASPVAQPAPQPGAKLTKEQILSSFGGAPQPQGMFPGQPGMMAAPGMMAPPGQMPMQYGQQQFMPQQQMPRYQQPVTPVMGVFPPGPSPAIPPRPGAMRPAVPSSLAGGAAQNPFGDASGDMSGGGGMLAPMSNNAGAQSGSDGAATKSDPFAGLVSGIGGTEATTKKDMFKNFQMAKPPQPPPRTNPPVSGTNEAAKPASDFDNYFLNSVGGLPLTDDVTNNSPSQATKVASAPANDPFAMGLVAQPAATTAGGTDPFQGNQAFSQAFEFNQGSNSQSLFG